MSNGNAMLTSVKHVRLGMAAFAFVAYAACFIPVEYETLPSEITTDIPKPESVADIFGGTGCKPKDDKLHSTVYVERNGLRFKMPLNKAWTANHDDNQTNNVTVMGVCS